MCEICTDPNQRQNAAFILRLDASRARRRAFFWVFVALITAWVFHIIWLSVVTIVISIFYWLAGWAMDKDADDLWPEQ